MVISIAPGRVEGKSPCMNSGKTYNRREFGKETEMTVSEIVKKMIAYSEGNLHDITHFLKVYAYAKTIGECERLDRDTQTVLAADFLRDTGFSEAFPARVSYLAGHHHTLDQIDGPGAAAFHVSA